MAAMRVQRKVKVVIDWLENLLSQANKNWRIDLDIGIANRSQIHVNLHVHISRR